MQIFFVQSESLSDHSFLVRGSRHLSRFTRGLLRKSQAFYLAARYNKAAVARRSRPLKAAGQINTKLFSLSATFLLMDFLSSEMDLKIRLICNANGLTSSLARAVELECQIGSHINGANVSAGFH